MRSVLDVRIILRQDEHMVPAVRGQKLTKKFGKLVAVDHIDFVVGKGECVGFLGPNGAGKTTTIRMVCCYTPITEGEVKVFGLDVKTNPRDVKAKLGICPQEDNLDPDFTVLKNLLVFARYFNVSSDVAKQRAEELLEFVQLKDKAREDIRNLSGGMKRRLILARSLINNPELLVLDEPTTGLDPQARQLIWQRLRQLKREGVSVLLTTHYMEEATQLCDRVILMDHGKILLQGVPKELIAKEIGKEVVELWNFDSETLQAIKDRHWTYEELEGRLYIYDRGGDEVSKEISKLFPNLERLSRPATLEDVFLARAGRSLKE